MGTNPSFSLLVWDYLLTNQPFFGCSVRPFFVRLLGMISPGSSGCRQGEPKSKGSRSAYQTIEETSVEEWRQLWLGDVATWRLDVCCSVQTSGRSLKGSWNEAMATPEGELIMFGEAVATPIQNSSSTSNTNTSMSGIETHVPGVETPIPQGTCKLWVSPVN